MCSIDLKSRFSTSDCCFTMSLVPLCTMMFFTVGVADFFGKSVCYGVIIAYAFYISNSKVTHNQSLRSGSCSKGANLFSSCTLACWGGLLLTPHFAAVHTGVLQSIGVHEALCLNGSAGQAGVSQISGRWALAVIRLSISNDLFFAPSKFQRGLLLADLLPDRQPCFFIVVLFVLVSCVLAFSCCSLF